MNKVTLNNNLITNDRLYIYTDYITDACIIIQKSIIKNLKKIEKEFKEEIEDGKRYKVSEDYFLKCAEGDRKYTYIYKKFIKGEKGILDLRQYHCTELNQYAYFNDKIMKELEKQNIRITEIKGSNNPLKLFYIPEEIFLMPCRKIN